jgi:hypothetical protein
MCLILLDDYQLIRFLNQFRDRRAQQFQFYIIVSIAALKTAATMCLILLRSIDSRPDPEPVARPPC